MIFLNHTSPEFSSRKGDLAVLLITIPILQMVFTGEQKEDDMNHLPGMLAFKKLREVQQLISLASNRAIKILVSWGSYSDERLDYLLGLRPSKNKEYYSESGFSFFQRCMAETEWEKLKNFFDLILKVSVR